MDNLLNVDTAWDDFMSGNSTIQSPKLSNIVSTKLQTTPKCSKLSISTKTMISYLSQPIDLNNVFWKINIIPYSYANEGVIKKQMKFSYTTKEYLNENLERINKIKENTNHPHIEDSILTHIDNPGGRIPFKSVRKISIGLSKKDIASYRCKKRSAFYNCFVVILRILHENKYREIHVKVFNTGKLEIPGIQTPGLLPKTLNLLVTILKEAMPPSEKTDSLTYLSEKSETVLINSNFNCGYYINRDRLYDILRKKYKINSAYDPCSYPGIQSEFYYDKTKTVQDGRQSFDANCEKKKINYIDNKNVSKVSFMMFRTGSVLIVGKCTETILNEIYDFLKNILETEYSIIRTGDIICDKGAETSTNKRVSRKRTIIVYQQ